MTMLSSLASWTAWAMPSVESTSMQPEILGRYKRYLRQGLMYTFKRYVFPTNGSIKICLFFSSKFGVVAVYLKPTWLLYDYKVWLCIILTWKSSIIIALGRAIIYVWRPFIRLTIGFWQIYLVYVNNNKGLSCSSEFTQMVYLLQSSFWRFILLIIAPEFMRMFRIKVFYPKAANYLDRLLRQLIDDHKKTKRQGAILQLNIISFIFLNIRLIWHPFGRRS